MTSPINVIGLMSGTSADGVDAALITTDGESLVETHESLFVTYSDALHRDILAVMRGQGDKERIAQALTDVHIEAVQQLLKKSKLPADAVGFHGQTIKHDPANGITEQIGDAARMAKTLGIPVIADFRSKDVKLGGQGAPLVPLYHAALSVKLAKPIMVVNIGGVSNVTWIGDNKDTRVGFHPEPGVSAQREGDGSPSYNLLAFDCGPGNALLNDWVHRHTGVNYDHNGMIAAKGKADENLLTSWMDDPFFTVKPPKSLDRNHFAHVTEALKDATLENGAATLTAFTAATIAQAVKVAPRAPQQLLVTGGGRHNPTLMRMIAAQVSCPVKLVEAVGWNGDMLEAQAFAYLAVRSMRGLPLTLPSTTGVREAATGGVFYPA